MLMYGRGVRLAVAMMGLSVVACGDDDKKPAGDDEVEVDGGDEVVGKRDGGLDASRSDAARPDAQLPSDSDAALADGAVETDDGDAAVDIDASQGDAASADAAPDAAPLDAQTDVPDANTDTPDTSVAPDANTDTPDSSVPDAASNTPDASLSDAGTCEINSPQYGCGRRSGTNWYVFDNGLLIDKVSHLAWSPPITFSTVGELSAKCDALQYGMLDSFQIPQIGDVRTFANGCDKTAWPNGDYTGKCSVMYGQVSLANSGTCTCGSAVGTGPKDGKFCQAASPICDTLLTTTSCGSSCGENPQNWYYNVDNGEIVLSAPNVGIGLTAIGRCRSYVTDTLLPTP